MSGKNEIIGTVRCTAPTADGGVCGCRLKALKNHQGFVFISCIPKNVADDENPSNSCASRRRDGKGTYVKLPHEIT